MVVFSGGTLTAVGTSGSRIIFTSMQDDSVGGDSGNDGATVGAPGQWYSIIVSGGALATLDYADVRYGGYGSANEAYGGIAVQTVGIADLDYYCARYMNQRSGPATIGGRCRTRLRAPGRRPKRPACTCRSERRPRTATSPRTALWGTPCTSFPAVRGANR